MKTIVDTCVWSRAFRRDNPKSDEIVRELETLIVQHRVQLVGPVRQEILSGIRHQNQFEKLNRMLDSFPDLPIETDDYVNAARFFNLCRSKGVQGSNTDFLLCALSARTKYPIFTTDMDFESFSKYLPIALHEIHGA